MRLESMAKSSKPRKKRTTNKTQPKRRPLRFLGRLAVSALGAALISIGIYAVVPPPTTPYVLSEGLRLGGIQRTWVSIDDVAPVMVRAVVAAEDANFCRHWGFDMEQLRAVIAQGQDRGASTLTQQTVKNVWLWQGRSWPRKAIEAAMTPLVELIWSKRRILEVYLNVAEFDEGVFGIEAAARHHFGKSASALSPQEASLLAAVLPNPKKRQAVNPANFTVRRAQSIADGAATIARDGRADCFE